MGNETGVAASGDTEGFAISHVMHVGRSWFRMTPAAVTGSWNDEEAAAQPVTATRAALMETDVSTSPGVKIARSLFEPGPVMEAPQEGRTPTQSRGTVTVSWSLLGILSAALLTTGAAAAAAMLRPQLSSLSAPAVSAAAPARPPSPVTVEPLVSAPASPSGEVAAVDAPAPVARPSSAPGIAPTAGRRKRVGAPRPGTATARREPSGPPATTWVDPFAD